MENNQYNLKKFCNFLTLILTILFFISTKQPTSAAETPQNYTNFLISKCSNTTYPTLCIKTLQPFTSYVQTDPLRLCNAALNVAIQGAHDASSTVSKLALQKGISHIEAAALKDCIYDVNDVIYELSRTLNEMGHLGDADREFKWANAKTWASAAISDAESCMDGFTGRNVSPDVTNKIRSCLFAQEKLISIALALINHLY
ncbi:hypothetical protein ACH5RR_017007 [Cinchona calisaya]|uniref:Pectinesterase inhibitor domain-containing protein n=1 Tax=Cinchona calisaya TaxID=153742 RepID=A0ABD2ZY02_9GENT